MRRQEFNAALGSAALWPACGARAAASGPGDGYLSLGELLITGGVILCMAVAVKALTCTECRDSISSIHNFIGNSLTSLTTANGRGKRQLY